MLILQGGSMKRGGFTLVELMIVVAVMGILTAVAIPKFADLIRKSKEGSTKGTLGAFRSALSIYYAENEGWFPVGTSAYVANVTYLETVLVPKYVNKWPECSVPPYHSRQTTVDNFPSFLQTWDADCDGEWSYIGNRQNGDWGKIFAECWSTDTKGTRIADW